MLLNGESIKNNAAFNMQFDVSGIFPEQQDKMSLIDAFKLIGREALLTDQIHPSDDTTVSSNDTIKEKMTSLAEQCGLSEMSDKFRERAEGYVESGYNDTLQNCIQENDTFVEFKGSQTEELVKAIGVDMRSSGYVPDEETGFATSDIDDKIRDVFNDNGVSSVGYNVLSEARSSVETGYNDVSVASVDTPDTVEQTISLETDITENSDAKIVSFSNGLGLTWPLSPENGVSTSVADSLFKIDPATNKLVNPDARFIISHFIEDKATLGSFEAEYRLYTSVMELTNKERTDAGLEPISVRSRTEVVTTGFGNDEIEKKAESVSRDSVLDTSPSDKSFGRFDSPSNFNATLIPEVKAFSSVITETKTKPDGTTYDVSFNLAQALRSVGRDALYVDKIKDGGSVSEMPEIKDKIDETLQLFKLEQPSTACYARILSEVDRSYNYTLSNSVQIGSRFMSFDRCKVTEALSEFGTKLGASRLLDSFDKTAFGSTSVGDVIVKEIFAKFGISFYGDKVFDKALSIIESGFNEGLKSDPISPRELDDILPWAIKSEYGVDVETTRAILSGKTDDKLDAILSNYTVDRNTQAKIDADITLNRALVDYRNERATETGEAKTEYTSVRYIDLTGIKLDSVTDKDSRQNDVTSSGMHSNDVQNDTGRFVDNLPGDYRILGKFIVDVFNCRTVKDVFISVGHLVSGMAIRDLSPISSILGVVDAIGGTDKESSLSKGYSDWAKEIDKFWTVEKRTFAEAYSGFFKGKSSSASAEELAQMKEVVRETVTHDLSGMPEEFVNNVIESVGIEPSETTNDVDTSEIVDKGIDLSSKGNIDTDSDSVTLKSYTPDSSDELAKSKLETQESSTTNAGATTEDKSRVEVTSKGDVTANADSVTTKPTSPDTTDELAKTKLETQESATINAGTTTDDKLPTDVAHKGDVVATSDAVTTKPTTPDTTDESAKAKIETQESSSTSAGTTSEEAKPVSSDESDKVTTSNVETSETDTTTEDSIQDSSTQSTDDSSLDVDTSGASDDSLALTETPSTEDDEDAAVIEEDESENSVTNDESASKTVGEELVDSNSVARDGVETTPGSSNDSSAGGDTSDGDNTILEDSATTFDGASDVTDNEDDNEALDSVPQEKKDDDLSSDMSSLYDLLVPSQFSSAVELISNIMDAHSAADVGKAFGEFVVDIFEAKLAQPFDTLDLVFDSGIGEKIHEFFDIVRGAFDGEQLADVFKGFQNGLSEMNEVMNDSMNEFLDNVYQSIEPDVIDTVIDPTTGETPQGFDSESAAQTATQSINDSVDEYVTDKLSDLEQVANDVTANDISNAPTVDAPADAVDIGGTLSDTAAEQMASSIEAGQQYSDLDNGANVESGVDTPTDPSASVDSGEELAGVLESGEGESIVETIIEAVIL